MKIAVLAAEVKTPLGSRQHFLLQLVVRIQLCSGFRPLDAHFLAWCERLGLSDPRRLWDDTLLRGEKVCTLRLNQPHRTQSQRVYAIDSRIAVPHDDAGRSLRKRPPKRPKIHI